MRVVGIDEVGRGCIAGPVIAAAVILDPRRPIPGLDDSKKLTPARRESLAEQIRQHAVAWSIGRAEAMEIDRLNIHHATLLAMARAYRSLGVAADLARVDGKFVPAIPCAREAVVGGDGLYAEISAASILAKVWRDWEMGLLDAIWPGYGLAGHKGYPTAIHISALARLGASPIHRRSYAPVAKVLRQAPLEFPDGASGLP
ncbi:ribonuclease HII [Methylogaea oryzae]|uniref:Ribonuclease HII n=1 Tax=Methylogaea oryzae TaxID=1295382 RepID=A0A8D4VQG0_9GAMM|nr:ribonuclease HII [Methylogaea oryzae]BBL70752.1 ribonuclease HII [Methylogaea oryzae]